MSAALRILIGFIVLLIGFSMVAKTGWYLGILGRVYWAERTFGSGGTRTYYKLFGVAITVIGMIIITDLWDIIVGEFLINLFTP